MTLYIIFVIIIIRKARCNLFFIPLGYNWIVPGKRGGTEARCNALIEYVAELNAWSCCQFILTADRPPGSTHTPMANEMAEYIKMMSGGRIYPIPQPLGWGTIAEIKHSIAYIQKIVGNQESVEVFISTNLGHIPRVTLYWIVLRPKGWKAVFIPANHSFTMKEWFQETAKVIRDIYRITTGKIKRTET